MDCHESLMQRRRKKKASAAGKRPGGPGVKLDKSLPSLPPSMEETRSIDEPAMETYEEVTETSHGKADGHGDSALAATGNRSMTLSVMTGATDQMTNASCLDNLILPSSTYRSSRQLGSLRDNEPEGDGEFLIPLTFDPSEVPRSSSNTQPPQELPREYFGQLGSGDSSLRTSRDGPDYTLEPPSRASSEHPSPHIAYQEKGREDHETNSGRRDMDTRNGWADKPSTSHSDRTRLGMSESARSSRSDLPLALRETSAFSGATSPDSNRSKEATGLDGVTSGSARPSTEMRRPHEHTTYDTSRSQPTPNMAYPPKRGDSLEGKHHQIPRKDVGASPASSTYGGSPRLPDTIDQQRQNLTSVNTTLDGAGSPSQTRYGSEFSPDEEQTSESFLRRMSNSVRHGRSFSDKSIRLGKDGKYPRSPANGSSIGTDIGSPTAGTTQAEEIAWLRNELRKERQRLAEMEAAVRVTADVKQVNTELSEKRSTMVVLDAKREIVLRELTVLTDHLEAEKRGAAGGPLDLGKLSNHVLRELAESIHKLKQSYTPQIEELIQKRNDLAEEVASLNRQKDKAFQEFEQLSSKNAQLAELNNTLVHQIQELYKTTSDGQRGANGLGIVSHSKDRSIGSLETLKPTIDSLAPSISTAHISDDLETQTATATAVSGPQVVNLRKGKFMNWKKGGQNVAKGVKGLKGAFMSSENAEGGGGLPRSQTQDPSRQGFGFFGNQRSKQGGKMSHADSAPVLAEAVGGGMFSHIDVNKFQLIVSQVSLVLISRHVWSMRGASSRPSLPGVFRRSNCEVRILLSQPCCICLTLNRNGHGRHLPQIRCSFRHSGYSRRL